MHADRMVMPQAGLSVEKMPAHWLMARLGKRVLRPGGREATRWLLDRARIDRTDDVVELAPGLGLTARALLARGPRSYVGVERDADAARLTEGMLATRRGVQARVVRADAARTGLDDESATLVLGEAMLSMQPARHKQAIIAEAARILRPGGRYLVHELCVYPDSIEPELHTEVEKDLSKSIHVGVRIGTPSQWREWIEAESLVVEAAHVLPMRLLEADRLIQDEGVRRAARFALNVVRTPGAFARLSSVRGTFRKHAATLRAIALVTRKLPRA